MQTLIIESNDGITELMWSSYAFTPDKIKEVLKLFEQIVEHKDDWEVGMWNDFYGEHLVGKLQKVTDNAFSLVED